MDFKKNLARLCVFFENLRVVVLLKIIQTRIDTLFDTIPHHVSYGQALWFQ